MAKSEIAEIREVLKKVYNGEMSLKDIAPPIILEYSVREDSPLIYYTKDGLPISELEMMEQVEKAKQKSKIVFHEIRTI